jgi:hypothetical protein
MQIVMIRGWSCAGKDTAATLLQELDSGYVRFAFADALKEMVAIRYASDGQVASTLAALYTQEGKQALCPIAGVSWRTLLLRVGAEERSKNPDVFAEATADRIASHTFPFRSPPKILITDWRYPNEYDVIRRRFPEADLRTVWVRRLDQEASPVHHFNEQLLQGRTGDYELVNSTMEGFRANVGALAEWLRTTRL